MKFRSHIPSFWYHVEIHTIENASKQQIQFYFIISTLKVKNVLKRKKSNIYFQRYYILYSDFKTKISLFIN